MRLSGSYVKIAVVLFNLGGPDSLRAVEPFLLNLFSDPAILPVPRLVRGTLGRVIAGRRAPVARKIYAKMGGRSPIVEETRAQGDALDKVLAQRGVRSKSFIAMRYWHPFSNETVDAVKAWEPDRVVMLPLYPQFSMTTTASSFDDWHRAACEADLDVPTARVCCYPDAGGFVDATAALIKHTLASRRPDMDYRLLLSAHGLPKRIVARGDPYQWQVERSARAIVDALGINDLDWQVCYQSRVGPLEWIGPATDAEIERAGREGKGVVIAPIAFVSEHSETLVELDIEYAELAKRVGTLHYLRVPTVSAHPLFIDALADLVVRAKDATGTVNLRTVRICPADCKGCICKG
ncbi:MAG: ferrochelatase [Alphaproteobacteria bacterium]|nr:ferrochelatase [Alphaproteobacteria bacterium]MBL6938995.1 ferrochelatase [Alphaproteobacteria bacterium]MBL7099587.1 ferrochelatase [Alphaproteobacteria bacterium]